MEKVISVFRMLMVFSMKLTPRIESQYVWVGGSQYGLLTQCLDVVLVPAALDVFDHQTCLANLRVADHAHLDDDRRILIRSFLPLVQALALCRRRSAQAVAVLQVVGRAGVGGVERRAGEACVGVGSLRTRVVCRIVGGAAAGDCVHRGVVDGHRRLVAGGAAASGLVNVHGSRRLPGLDSPNFAPGYCDL